MLFSRTRTALTRQARHYREWRDWDIVLELDQREGDPAPAFAISYMQVLVDWDDGNNPVTYTRSSSTQTQTYSGAYPAGTHVVKIKVTNRYNNAGTLYFGNGTASTLIGEALMPQVVRIKKFDISGTVAGRTKVQSINCGFNRCLRLEGVDCPLILGNTTDLNSVFRYCINLRGKVEIPYIAAAQSLTNFFYNCINLEEVCIGDSPTLSNFGYLCYNCPSLRRVKLGSYRLGSSFVYAFYGCKSLVDIAWGQLRFVQMTYFLYGCSSLEQIPDIGDQKTCASISYAFAQCQRLKKIELGDFSACTSITHAFEFCTSLTEVAMSGLELVGDASGAFYYCKSLRALTLGGFGPEVTLMVSFAGWCERLERFNGVEGELTLPDLPKCTSLSNAFQANSPLRKIVLGDCPLCTNIANICTQRNSLEYFKAGSMPLVATANDAFNGCENLVYLELHCNGSTINNMANMFYMCSSLRKLTGEARMRPQGPSTAIYWNNIFSYCRSLEELPDIFPTTGWDASFAVANIQHLNWFSNCVSLSGEVPAWIWETWPGRRSLQENTFLNCYKLLNYNDIPNYWKGGGITI